MTQLPHSPSHQEAMKFVPLEWILLETDAPTAYQGKASEPADLIVTATALSRLKGVGLEQIKEVTTQNARRFFGI